MPCPAPDSNRLPSVRFFEVGSISRVGRASRQSSKRARRPFYGADLTAAEGKLHRGGIRNGWPSCDDAGWFVVTCIGIRVTIAAERQGAFDNDTGNIKANASWKTHSFFPVMAVK